MPQMAPLNWTLIFIFSLTILMVCATKIFFSTTIPNINKKKLAVTEHSSNPLAWKW